MLARKHTVGHSFCVRRLVLSCAARPHLRVASRNFHGEWLGRRSGIDIPIQKSQPADHRLFNSKINDELQRHNANGNRWGTRKWKST